MSVTRPHPISVSDADGRQPQRSGPYVPAVARFVIETCASADSVEFLVGRRAIHFSDEFLELGILIFPVRHHRPFAHAFHLHRVSALLLLLVARVSLTSVLSDNGRKRKNGGD